MARSVPYRHQITELVNWNQLKANNETLFILREIGPVGFIVQEEGNTKKFKVCLGDQHNCTCKDFQKEKDLCKHICWVLLKKFKLDKDDPLTWQLGLVQREIDELIFSKRNSSNIRKIEKPASVDPENGVSQRKIEPDDVCPICQEDLLTSQRPVTYCKNSCGNNIHVRCMVVWTEHKRKELDLKMQDSIPCPICRGDFGTLNILMMEMNNSKDNGKRKPKVSASIRHPNTECNNCRMNPVVGKIYKCNSCLEYVLCGVCFNENIHSHHQFLYREFTNGRWLAAPNSRGLPSSLINGLENNDLESYDYSLLQQLDKPVSNNSIRQQDLNHLPSWTVTNRSKLIQPGHQCRMCLMSYKIGDIVRKLPRCQHIFHCSCIDQWLLHRTSHCPIDEVEVSRAHDPISRNNKIERSNAPPDNQTGSATNHLKSALFVSPLRNGHDSSSIGQKMNKFTSEGLIKSAPGRPRKLPPINNLSNNFHIDNQYGLSLSITPVRFHSYSTNQ